VKVPGANPGSPTVIAPGLVILKAESKKMKIEEVSKLQENMLVMYAVKSTLDKEFQLTTG
jgi:hypothetical protein